MSLALGDQQLLDDVALMSRPRMLFARVPEGVQTGVAANFTPPALPRPPALTRALTMTGSADFLSWRSLFAHPCCRGGDPAGRAGDV